MSDPPDTVVGVFTGRLVGPDGPKRAARFERLTIVGDEPGDPRLELTVPGMPGARPIELTYFAAADRIDFDRCPICLTHGPDTEEHVPPQSTGGRAMTRTCERCNNELGSRLDAALVSWLSQVVDPVRFEAPSFTGHRYLPGVAVRDAGAGRFALLADGKIHPDVRGAFRPGGTFTLTFPIANLARVELAALKNAYLAACLFLGSIPDSPDAAAIRGVLIAVRDAPRHSQLPAPPVPVPVGRPYTPIFGDRSVTLARADLDGAPRLWIGLGGLVATGWPVPDRQPDCRGYRHGAR